MVAVCGRNMWGHETQLCAVFVGKTNVIVAFKSFCDEGCTKLRPLCALNLSDLT